MLNLLAAFLLIAQEPASFQHGSAIPLGDSEKPQAAPAWSATTLEAANKEEHKAVLKAATVATITGEVLDLSCYTQLGKTGEGHKACGSLCVANGAPVGLLTKEGKVYMILAEQHHPRRDGQVSIAQAFSKKVAETVTLTGLLSHQGGMDTLFIELPLTASK